MTRMRIIAVVCSLPLIFLVLFGTAHAAVEFSADIVIVPKGGEPIKGRVFIKGGKIRQETADEDNIQVMVIRPDKKLTWLIEPEGKTYTEMPYQVKGKTLEEWTADKQKSARFLGEETVSGMPCKKYEATEDGEKTLFWISEQLPFPIKIEDPRLTVQYHNIKLGALDDSLFEPPAGYEKIDQ